MDNARSNLNDFLFCRVCRRNHNLGKKHIYSRKHVTNTSHIVQKYGKKIEEARKTLFCPLIVHGELEPGSKFWCHFCGMDVQKHTSDGDISVQFGGVFEHLACLDHVKQTHQWWKENGADKSDKSIFILSQPEIKRFKESVKHKLEELEKEGEKDHDKAVLLILAKEELQRKVAEQVCSLPE